MWKRNKKKTEETGNAVQNTDFTVISEKIKAKPINRKKLLRRSVITASMAVIFALVACVTFLLLEPVISNWLYPEPEEKHVTFPEEEIQPEDMLQEDVTPEPQEPIGEPEAESITTIIEKVGLGIEDYQNLHNQIYHIAKEASKSLVTVTGVTSDVDWFDNQYENKEQAAGVIIEENGKELFILINKKAIEKADTIRVTFPDGTQTEATIKKTDTNTGLAVLAVDLQVLSGETKESYTRADLGSSNAANLLGAPIIAIGSPLGTNGSMVYGIVTSAGTVIKSVDSQYRLITTDIYGSTNAGGVLINLKGQIIGITTTAHNPSDMENMLSAIGITELKPIFGKMCNGKDSAYLGIYGTEVTKEAHDTYDVPYGAYVKEIVTTSDSPAMRTGIQSGDVIIRIGDREIVSYSEYIAYMNECQPGVGLQVTVMRQGKEGYVEMSFYVTTDVMP